MGYVNHPAVDDGYATGPHHTIDFNHGTVLMKPASAVVAVVAVALSGLWSLGLATAHANPAAAPAAADVLKGKPAFEANCAACHQATGKGLPGAFPPLAGSDWLQGKAPSQVAEVVLKGLQGAVAVNGVTYDNVMPSQSGINDADIAAIVTYVLNQWGNPGGSISADEVKALRVTPDAGPAKPR